MTSLNWTERMERLLEVSGYGVYHWDLPTNSTRYGGGLSHFIGLPFETMNSGTMKWASVIHPHDLSVFERELNRSVGTGEPFHLCYRVRHRDGHWVSIQDDGFCFKNDKGEVVEMMGFLADVTSRLEAEEAIRLRDQRLELVLTELPAVLWVVDKDYRISTSVGSFLSKINLKSHELVGTSLYDYVGTTDPNNPILRQHREAIGGQSLNYQSEVAGRILMTRMEPVHNSKGEITGCLGLSFDITEQKESEQKLKQVLQDLERSNSELDQFASVIAHDLEEPLRMVTCYLKLLLNGYDKVLDKRAHEYIEFARDGALRMSNMIREVFAYSRMGNEPLRLTEFSMEELVLLTTKNLEFAIAESGAELSVDPLPSIKADRLQMGQVLQNLLMNAIKYRSEKALKIHLGASESEHQWEFWVQDNGRGVRPENTDRIFMALQRVPQLQPIPGSGLGLSICKKIVERHGGKISVCSQEGEGSTFRFSIPKKLVTSV